MMRNSCVYRTCAELEFGLVFHACIHYSSAWNQSTGSYHHARVWNRWQRADPTVYI